MIFYCFAVNIKEHIKYATKPHYWSLTMKVEKDKTTYFDFMVKHNKWS